MVSQRDKSPPVHAGKDSSALLLAMQVCPVPLSQHSWSGPNGQLGKKGDPNPGHWCSSRGFATVQTIMQKGGVRNMQVGGGEPMNVRTCADYKTAPNSSLLYLCSSTKDQTPVSEDFAFSALIQMQVHLQDF